MPLTANFIRVWWNSSNWSKPKRSLTNAFDRWSTKNWKRLAFKKAMRTNRSKNRIRSSSKRIWVRCLIVSKVKSNRRELPPSHLTLSRFLAAKVMLLLNPTGNLKAIEFLTTLDRNFTDLNLKVNRTSRSPWTLNDRRLNFSCVRVSTEIFALAISARSSRQCSTVIVTTVTNCGRKQISFSWIQRRLCRRRHHRIHRFQHLHLRIHLVKTRRTVGPVNTDSAIESKRRNKSNKQERKFMWTSPVLMIKSRGFFCLLEGFTLIFFRFISFAKIQQRKPRTITAEHHRLSFFFLLDWCPIHRQRKFSFWDVDGAAKVCWSNA